MATSSFRLLTTRQLGELPPAENLCGTRFMARGLNVVFGPSGTYKSFYVLGQALRIAQSLPVVYVAAEGSSGLSNRVTAWSEYHQLPSDNLHFICEEVNLRDDLTVQRLIQSIKPLKPKLVVFDTLARCLVGGDENSAKDVGLAVHNCSRVQRHFNTAISIVHHSNKADRGERGSGAFRGAPHVMIEVSTSGDGMVRASCSKIKDSDPWEPDVLTFRSVGQSGLLVPVTEAFLVSLRLTPTEKSILGFVSLSIFESDGPQVQQLMNALNISERHVYRVLSGLKNRGLIDRGNKGFPVVLTDMGKEIILTFTDISLPVAQPVAEFEVD